MDFRQHLYPQYVTTSSGTRSAGSVKVSPAIERLFDHLYLPHLAGVRFGDPVLEIGCGSGLLLEYLAGKGYTCALGVDVSEEQIACARQRGVKAVAADLTEFLRNAQPNEFAAVLAIDVVEHFSKDEILALFGLVHRALRPGGLFVVQTPNGQGLFSGQVIFGDLTHITILSPDSFLQVARHAGFQETAFFETGPQPLGTWGWSRVVLWRWIKRLLNAVRSVEAYKTQAIWTDNMIGVCRKP